MSHHHHSDKPELDAILRREGEILHEVEEIEQKLDHQRLSSIKIQFSKGTSMAAPVVGPVTLTAVGQSVVASVAGFDQFGNPFTGTIPTPTFSASDTAGAVAKFDPATGLVTAVANGTDSITATLTSAEGLTLTDTEVVTVAIPTVAPVLSSIKVAFA